MWKNESHSNKSDIYVYKNFQCIENREILQQKKRWLSISYWILLFKLRTPHKWIFNYYL